MMNYNCEDLSFRFMILDPELRKKALVVCRKLFWKPCCPLKREGEKKVNMISYGTLTFLVYSTSHSWA